MVFPCYSHAHRDETFSSHGHVVPTVMSNVVLGVAKPCVLHHVCTSVYNITGISPVSSVPNAKREQNTAIYTVSWPIGPPYKHVEIAVFCQTFMMNIS